MPPYYQAGPDYRGLPRGPYAYQPRMELGPPPVYRSYQAPEFAWRDPYEYESGAWRPEDSWWGLPPS